MCEQLGDKPISIA